jgi:hypothetical protein
MSLSDVKSEVQVRTYWYQRSRSEGCGYEELREATRGPNPCMFVKPLS